MTQTLILFTSLSDHLAPFISIKYTNNAINHKNNNTVNVRQYTKRNEIKFLEELSGVDFGNIIENDTNPSNNYKLISDRILDLFNKHFPVKQVKFNKYKHKKNSWMTFGILKSIKQKDKYYKRFKSTPTTNQRYEFLKNKFKIYSKTLKTVITNAKKIHFQNEFEKYKNDVKILGPL